MLHDYLYDILEMQNSEDRKNRVAKWGRQNFLRW